MFTFVVALILLIIVLMVLLGYVTTELDSAKLTRDRYKRELDQALQARSDAIKAHQTCYDAGLELKNALCARAEQDLRACGRLSEEKRVV